MAAEAPEIRLIRETLEGVLHPSTASTLFFVALQESGGALPQTANEALELVNGPIRRALIEKLGEDGALVADQLGMMLASISRTPRKRPSRHDETTRAIQLSGATLPVFILTANADLVPQLSAALGPEVMSPLLVRDAAMLRDRLAQIAPSFVLIDASDFPAIDPSDLAQTLRPLPSTVVKAVWGAGLPYGQGVMGAAHQLGFSLTPFERSEGTEPMLDIIRSRQL